MVCVSVQEKDFGRCSGILAQCGMVELRGDLCNFTTPQIEKLVQGHPNLLYTHRIAGSTQAVAREQMVAAIKKGAKYVDVEIEAPVDHLEYIKSYARANGCRLVVSYHNFEGTQDLEELKAIYDICRRKGADIVKIVTTANNISDACRTMQLYSYKKSDRELVPDNFMEHGELSGSLSNSFGEEQASLVAFCMGEAGRFTRHLCLQLGAPYTYAALDAESATAPGQYTRDEMERLLEPANYPYTTLRLEETIFAGKPEVHIPCSKSIAQRAVLAAALANGTSVLENFEPCNDISGAVEVIKALGARVSLNGGTLAVESAGIESLKGTGKIFTGESGLLTRLLIPMAAYLSGGEKEIEITGTGSILKRNLGESVKALEAAGAQCCTNGGYLPFRIGGGITRRNIEFSGKESSQIVSGFLMTLPLLEEDSTLTITNPASLPYIELTLRVLRQFGIEIRCEEFLPDRITYHIRGGQKYTPARIWLDSDWSSAANFAVAGALSNGVVLKNMPLSSAQADEFILKLLELYGYGVSVNGSDVEISPRPGEAAAREDAVVEASLKDCPDLFPIVALLAAHSGGRTVFEGADRLAQKESNRAETVYCELVKLGYGIHIEGDKMYICGNGAGPISGGRVPVLGCGHNDHRISMALYIAALFCGKKILLDSIKCIDKSFPSFLERLKG